MKLRQGLLVSLVLMLSVAGIAGMPLAASAQAGCHLGLDNNGNGDFNDKGDVKPVVCQEAGYYCKVAGNSNTGKCTCAVGKFEMPLSFGGSNAFPTDDVCKWVNSQGGTPLVNYFNIVVNIGIVIVIGVGLVTIVVGGYFYMTAGGNAQRISQAKTIIVMALLGIILALTAYLLLNTISPQFTNIDESKFNLTP